MPNNTEEAILKAAKEKPFPVDKMAEIMSTIDFKKLQPEDFDKTVDDILIKLLKEEREQPKETKHDNEA